MLAVGVGPLLDAARAVQAVGGLPRMALIGGLAVTARVAATQPTYRATADVDLVVDDVEPSVLELLADAGLGSGSNLRIDGVKVDVIPTVAFGDDDLVGLDDADRLFVVAHRWAIESAQPMRLLTPVSSALTIRVATPAGLIAAKCHAVAFARSGRRATKHGSDLLDVFSLVDALERNAIDELRTGPGDVARLVADVIAREVLENPAAAGRAMSTSAGRPISAEVVDDVLGGFVRRLRSLDERG